jgi:hypothetical protein
MKGDVEFYIECAKEFGGTALETGTRRLLWPIAKAEHDDAAIRERVTLHQADLTSFDLEQSFALAIIPLIRFCAIGPELRPASNNIGDDPSEAGDLAPRIRLQV